MTVNLSIQGWMNFYLHTEMKGVEKGIWLDKIIWLLEIIMRTIIWPHNRVITNSTTKIKPLITLLIIFICWSTAQTTFALNVVDSYRWRKWKLISRAGLVYVNCAPVLTESMWLRSLRRNTGYVNMHDISSMKDSLVFSLVLETWQYGKMWPGTRVIKRPAG